MTRVERQCLVTQSKRAVVGFMVPRLATNGHTDTRGCDVGAVMCISG